MATELEKLARYLNECDWGSEKYAEALDRLTELSKTNALVPRETENCAFQYATSDGFVMEDTGLIKLSDANSLWEKYIPQFKKHFEDGRSPEMAIWVDMKTSCDYHTTSKHWCAEDMVIRDGILCEVRRVE